ncbi:hypothetical protein TBR22_A16460 [Luteitalea sp. TBR-22]|uniref:cytochrome c n=1 Tax=Luteitalea sp. TBR-22 TaxID=2802971 RepID=UPI001AF3CDB2|nr:cytochrome c [Luteitalea sp. TBR-22]BCS32432.1 hypothetical protein TBR22_A16460 [Luteitalea sp. TBR-22]
MLTSRAAWATVTSAGAILLAAVVAGTNAQPTTAPTIKKVPYHDIASVDGRSNYVAYCASCHGLSGKGDGPAAPALKAMVPDLTMMSARRGGKFDVLAIERFISGVDRAVPAAHGSVDMPVWGPMFRSGGVSNATAQMRLTNLATYLKSIQKPQS